CSREGRQEMLGPDARKGRNAEWAGPVLQQRVIGSGGGHLCLGHGGHMGLYGAPVHLTSAQGGLAQRYWPKAVPCSVIHRNAAGYATNRRNRFLANPPFA